MEFWLYHSGPYFIAFLGTSSATEREHQRIDVHDVQAAHDVHVDDDVHDAQAAHDVHDDDDDVHDVQAAHDVQHDAQAASWKLVLPCRLMRPVLPFSR